MFKFLWNTISKLVKSIVNSLQKHPTTEIYDLTLPISSSTVIFPGDPVFSSTKVQSLEKDDSYNLCCLSLGNHTGTHIDYPAHVIKDGNTSSNYPIQRLMGPGVIIEVPEAETKDMGITAAFIRKSAIVKNDIVFFKTSNSKLARNTYTDQFVYLTPAAADELIQNQVKMVGIDYLSVDSIKEEKLPVHHKLLGRNILIVENLDLRSAPARRFNEIAIIPPNIPEMDGLPVRVLAR